MFRSATWYALQKWVVHYFKQNGRKMLLSFDLFTLSCTRCTFQCCPSAARLQSEWKQSYWCWVHGTPPWSAKSCRCWQSSGRCLVAPDTPQRVVLESLLDSCLKMSETDHHPHHLHLYAAVTGNYINSTTYCTSNVLTEVCRSTIPGLILLYQHLHMQRTWEGCMSVCNDSNGIIVLCKWIYH